MDELILNDVWCLYFHDPTDSDWTLKSYKRICNISSSESYWAVQNLLQDKLSCGMFFLMREHVFPCWDDQTNIEGGCLSIKVLKQDLKQFWEHFAIRALGECLFKDHELSVNINGISTSPKKHFCIIKIWLKTNDHNTRDYFDFPETYQGEILYKSNKDNISNQ